MALTKEIIIANESLKQLTDDQLNALITMSKNDEATVIGDHTGKIYRSFDEKIKTIAGIDRNGDEKTYDYAERALKQLVGSTQELESLKTQVSTLNAEKLKLEKAIQDGNTDTETKKLLDAKTAEVAQITNLYNTLKSESDTLKDTHNKEVMGMRIDSDISSALSGIKFASHVTKPLSEVLLQGAKDSVRALNPEYVDGKLVYKDASGNIMKNPQNQLNPFTTSELVTEHLKKMDVLDLGRGGAGGGTGAGGSGKEGGNGGVIDLSQAKNQVEAHGIVKNFIHEKGITYGSENYTEEFDKAWKENFDTIKELPVQ